MGQQLQLFSFLVRSNDFSRSLSDVRSNDFSRSLSDVRSNDFSRSPHPTPTDAIASRSSRQHLPK
ncbi:MAG: hypothetical protein ACRC8Y_20025 [Chroococcales cyanobacterium]